MVDEDGDSLDPTAAAWLHATSRPATARCWIESMTVADINTVLAEAKALVSLPGGGWTHWMEAEDKARCALESLVLAIMRFHLSHQQTAMHATAGPVGVEYWIQVRAPDEPMSMHWDCDEERKGKTDVHVPPYLATVTYLTSVGAPTLVLPIAADERGQAYGLQRAASGAGSALLDAYASFPVAGKHLAFDGRLLHGAPWDDDETTPSSEPTDSA